MSTPSETLQPSPPAAEAGLDPGADSAAAPQDSQSALDGLTKRQRQILELLRDGKGNKEIAYELGINIGTVKQHVVALFKKLNVRNRTMAVAKTFGAPQSDTPDTLPASSDLATTFLVPSDEGTESDTILEKRPCVILSLAVAQPTDPNHRVDDQTLKLAARHLHTSLAALAYDHDAVFLARRGNAADVIFGVQRTREFDLLRALRTAQSVSDEMKERIPQAQVLLRGGITASLAVASMMRRGGWSGEAIASAGISVSRLLADNSPEGCLTLGEAALDLMVAHGIGNGPEGLAQLCQINNGKKAGTDADTADKCVGCKNNDGTVAVPFSELRHVRATESAASVTLRGRLTELATLFHAWTETPEPGTTVFPPVLILGEAGMGKSHLALTFARRSNQDGAALSLRRCQPSDGSGREPFLACDQSGHDHSLNDVLDMLQNPIEATDGQRELVVLDDVHWLSSSDQHRLFKAACTYQPGRLVLMAARRLPNDILDGSQSDSKAPVAIRLKRLPPDVTEAIAADRLKIHASGDQSLRAAKAAGKGIAGRAMGVPLFAVELARHWKSFPIPDSTGTDATKRNTLSPLWASTPPLSLLTIVCARLDSQGLDRTMLRAVAKAPRPLDGPGLARFMGEPDDVVSPLLQRAISAGVLAWTDQGTLTYTHPVLRAVIDFLGIE